VFSIPAIEARRGTDPGLQREGHIPEQSRGPAFALRPKEPHARAHARANEGLRMDFDFDDWQDASRTIAVDRWITRTLDHLPEPERGEPRECKRGTPFTEHEIEAFKRSGREINYCGERLAKQEINDRRAAERKEIRPFGGGRDLIDTVIDAIAFSGGPNKLLTAHRATAEAILDKPCNARSKKLSGLPPRRWRHQHAIRIARALAFDGITQAEYCKKHKIRGSQASRMLADLYEREPGLADAIIGISACAAMVFWQNRQQSKMLRQQESGRKEVGLVFGWDRFDDAIEPFPRQVMTLPCMARSGGGFRHLNNVKADESEADNTRVWYADILADEIALAVFNQRATPIRAAAPYRFQRPLARAVKLKTSKRGTWNPIARAVPIEAWFYAQHHDDSVMSWSVADQVFLSRPSTVLAMPPRWRPANDRIETIDELRRNFFGLIPDGKWRIEPKAKEYATLPARRFTGQWCMPVRSRMWLAGVSAKAISAGVPLWESFGNEDSLRKPHGIIQPFTQLKWKSRAVKQHKVLSQQKVCDGPVLYVCSPPCPNGKRHDQIQEDHAAPHGLGPGPHRGDRDANRGSTQLRAVVGDSGNARARARSVPGPE
jgi:hypothetical protein